jgi:hypothetical protein
LSTTGPTAAVRVWTWRGRSGMTEGSGNKANPWASSEVSREGRSLKEKRTASRAPAASITTVSMVRAVWRKSRSAVSSGPKSVNASNVLKIFLRLVPCNPLAEAHARNQSPISLASGPQPDYWLVWCEKYRMTRLLEERGTIDGVSGEEPAPDTYLDRRASLAHTSAKSPAPLAFCHRRPATNQPRESCGSARI